MGTRCGGCYRLRCLSCRFAKLSCKTSLRTDAGALVKPALSHYLRLSFVLLKGESLNMLEQHLSVGWQD